MSRRPSPVPATPTGPRASIPARRGQLFDVDEGSMTLAFEILTLVAVVFVLLLVAFIAIETLR